MLHVISCHCNYSKETTLTFLIFTAPTNTFNNQRISKSSIPEEGNLNRGRTRGREQSGTWGKGLIVARLLRESNHDMQCLQSLEQENQNAVYPPMKQRAVTQFKQPWEQKNRRGPPSLKQRQTIQCKPWQQTNLLRFIFPCTRGTRHRVSNHESRRTVFVLLPCNRGR